MKLTAELHGGVKCPKCRMVMIVNSWKGAQDLYECGSVMCDLHGKRFKVSFPAVELEEVER